MNKDKIMQIFNIFIPSEEMREYLSFCELNDQQVADIIVGSPVSLETKAKWAWGKNKIEINKALAALMVNDGELLTLTEEWYDEDIKETKSCSFSPFTSYQKAKEHIKGELDVFGNDRYDCQWDVLEKWELNNKNVFQKTYKYYMINGEPCYFYYETDDMNSRYCYSFDCQHKDIPVPYKKGDIVELDCTPFIPKQNGIIIDMMDSEICKPIIRYEKANGEYSTFPLHEGSLYMYENGFSRNCISPIYRIKSVQRKGETTIQLL